MITGASGRRRSSSLLLSGNHSTLCRNAKVPAPMPTIVSASSAGHALPPPAAFQPALRILKRPSPSSSTPGSSSNSSTPDPSNLKEREAQYQAARERIFGADSPANPPAMGANTQPPAARIVREPRGPGESKGSEPGQEIKGFTRRGGAKTAPPSMPPPRKQ
jgi:hypothetical protein